MDSTGTTNSGGRGHDADDDAGAERVIEEIDAEECLALLGSHQVGRVAVVVGIHPVIFPVNYCLDGDAVVFRTGEGAKLQGAAGHPVGFEVDAVDVGAHTGWSVHVWGKASDVTEQNGGHEARRVQRLALEPWAVTDASHWIRIDPVSITGRRIRPT